LDAWIVIVLLGVVILLYAFLLPKTSPRKLVDEDVLDTVEDTLQQFVEEMEQENREFARMVGEMKREHERKTAALLDRIEFLERKTAMLTEQLSAEQIAGSTESKEASQPQPQPLPLPAPKPDEESAVASRSEASTVKSRYKEVFELYDSGKSIEYIAKKLGTNKGEVQLIIQLAKREEEADASK
jgi:DNA-binding NarL/FixJ family response regulator